MDTTQDRYISKRFENKFPNDDACLELLKNYRFPTGIKCVICKKVTKHRRNDKRPCYKCDTCGHEVHPTDGTIFHRSNIPLKIWFEAMFWSVTVSPHLSAKELQRRTGVSYKTAWRMLNKLGTLPNDLIGLFVAISLTVGEPPNILKPIIKDFAKRLIPAVSIRMGIPQKEVQKRLSINFLPTSKKINAYANPKTFSIIIPGALMVFYHKMLKVFVSTLNVGIKTQIMEKRKIPPKRILNVCRKLMHAYLEDKILEEGGFLLEELTEGQSTVLSYLRDGCECFAVAHELGHIVNVQTKGNTAEYSEAKNAVEEFLNKVPDLKIHKTKLIKPWSNEICADLIGLQLGLQLSISPEETKEYKDWQSWLSCGAQISLLLQSMFQEYEDRLANKTTISYTHPPDMWRAAAIRKRSVELNCSDPYDLCNRFVQFALSVLDNIFIKTETGDYKLKNPN